MFRFAHSLVAALLLTIALTGCQTEPLTEPQPAADDTEAKVLALLSVNPNGTVAITDEAKMAALLGSAWNPASNELAALNRRILAGQASRFLSTADLARYTRSQPSYQPNLDLTGEVIFTAASDDPRNPQCRDECNKLTEMCCCGGFWFLCWSVCGCKP